MSLKDSYNLQSRMKEVFDLGLALIQPTPTPAYSTIQAALEAAAASGEKTFIVNITHNADGTSLDLEGLYWDTYKSGIASALAAEYVYDYEFDITLNKTVTSTVSVDLTFTF